MNCSRPPPCSNCLGSIRSSFQSVSDNKNNNNNQGNSNESRNKRTGQSQNALHWNTKLLIENKNDKFCIGTLGEITEVLPHLRQHLNVALDCGNNSKSTLCWREGKGREGSGR